MRNAGVQTYGKGGGQTLLFASHLPLFQQTIVAPTPPGSDDSDGDVPLAGHECWCCLLLVRSAAYGNGVSHRCSLWRLSQVRIDSSLVSVMALEYAADASSLLPAIASRCARAAHQG